MSHFKKYTQNRPHYSSEEGFSKEDFWTLEPTTTMQQDFGRNCNIKSFIISISYYQCTYVRILY